KVSPSEQRRAVLAHASPYQICLRVFCNRSLNRSHLPPRVNSLHSSRSTRPDASHLLRAQPTACDLQIIVRLQVHPELRGVAEIQTQPQRRIGRNTPPVVDDLGDPV